MTAHENIYACLYAKEFPVQVALRLRPNLRGEAVVVLEGEAPFQSICSLNSSARRLGIVQGMTKAEMDTFPAVVTVARTVSNEVAAKAALLDCGWTFSPRIEEQCDNTNFICVLDITGTEKLFGPARAVAQALKDRVKAAGVIAAVAVSHNFHTAICVARGATRAGVSIVARRDDSAALAELPGEVLKLAEEQAGTFRDWGIRTLGALAALPETELIARMGQEGKRLRQLARGEREHLFVPLEPEFTLEERMELDTPVELLDSLLFVAGVMLEQLILRASARVLALASVTAVLSLEGGAEHTRTVKPALPSNDRQLWIKLLHLDLEAHPPQAAILSVALKAEPGKTSKAQLGLFSPQLPEPMRLELTLARIKAIVGEECAGTAVLKNMHRPDSFRMEPFTAATKPGEANNTEPSVTNPAAAMRWLRPAEAVTVTMRERQPYCFFFRGQQYGVQRAYGPWRAGGEWWSAELWSRDEWDLVARANDGTRLCGCLVHDLTENTWQLVALYD